MAGISRAAPDDSGRAGARAERATKAPRDAADYGQAGIRAGHPGPTPARVGRLRARQGPGRVRPAAAVA
ncbi:hypothetical protein [Propionibacterium australiense]|uniref:Uncharacterized protein n=1 Tax=Propionibacterium australiense TaxID=119981 RepID=A0A8B3FJG3_9ACTN|nr:hypothetical protein [Propionibacterium australiense]RLP09823.1 hypothetical protein D9T14_06785 [Propionibacterium australiense]RLP10128.1 hypothetical protein D7U36_06025 [Propionibacterium australiense]